MCGFVCEYRLSGIVDELRLSAALDSIRHRGPDESSTWLSEDATVGMAHARLSIVGLSSGLQPLYSERERLTAVVNGEFYDHLEVRRRYCDYNFRTGSDSEILLPVYARKGIGGFQDLRGEFSFVIWDASKRTLVSARDRFGIKPLYYAVLNDRILFASEIKGILASGVVADWNAASVHGSERMLYPSRDSCFKNIRQVPPGHAVTVERGRVRVVPYFSKPIHLPSKFGSPREAAKNFLASFDNAVETRLKADVGIGCYLSGGIDSCSVLGTASHLLGVAPESFTINFSESDFSEINRARLQAEFVGSKLNILDVSEYDIVDNFERAVWAFESPFGNAHGVAKLLLSAEVRRSGIKVVLTGEGADEVLAGYPHFREDIYRCQTPVGGDQVGQGRLQELYAQYAAFPGFLIEGALEKDLQRFSQRWGYTPGMLRTGSRRGEHFLRLYRPEFAAFHDSATPYCDALTLVNWEQIRGYDIAHKSLELWQQTVLPSYILSVLGDRAEMANSVEARPPFLDHKLFETIMRLPTELKIFGSIEKYILRLAMQGRVHPSILAQSKMPFMAPPAEVCSSRSPMRTYMGDIINSKHFDNQPFYCPTATRMLFDKIPSMSSPERLEADRILTFITSICVMQKIFNFGRVGGF